MSGYVITTYNGDELYHHGIMGMKWGVRNYQNKDGSLTPLGRKRYGYAERAEAKGDRARTTLGKAWHYDNAAQSRYELQRGQKVHDAKGLGNKFSEAYGHGNAATYYHEMNKAHSKMAEYARSKGKRGQRKYSEAAEFNTKQMEKYHKQMQKATKGQKIIEALTGSNLKNVTIQRMSGRKATIGKQRLDLFFTGGTVGAVKDAIYVHKNKKAAKAIYKSEMAKAKSAYKSAYNKYSSAADAASANKAAYKEARRKAKIKYRNSY